MLELSCFMLVHVLDYIDKYDIRVLVLNNNLFLERDIYITVLLSRRDKPRLQFNLCACVSVICVNAFYMRILYFLYIFEYG